MFKRVGGLIASTFFILGLVVSTLFLAPVDASPNQSVVKREHLVINVDGASTSGSDTTDLILEGEIVRVDIDFASGLTTTSDLSISGVSDLVTTEVVSLTNTATDTVMWPGVGMVDNGNTALTYTSDNDPVVSRYYYADKLVANLRQTSAATPAVTIDIYYVEEP